MKKQLLFFQLTLFLLLCLADNVLAQTPCNEGIFIGSNIAVRDGNTNFLNVSPLNLADSGNANEVNVVDGTEYCTTNSGANTQLGLNEGPDLEINIPVEEGKRYSCSSGILTIILRGDFNNTCEVAYIVDENDIIIAQSDVTGLVETSNDPINGACGVTFPLEVEISPCALNELAADGLITFYIRTNGDNVDTCCTGDDVDNTCDDPDQDGNCMGIQSFIWPINLPEITCSPDVTIQCSESSDPTNTGMPTVGGGCAVEPTVDFVDSVVDGACSSESVITRTWSATDECGMVVTCDQIINIIDNTSPIITCPENISGLTCTDSLPTITTSTVNFESLGGTVSDNCAINALTAEDDLVFADIDFCVGGIITRTYTLTDACGNTGTCEQTFTFNPDTTPPTFDNIPQDSLSVGCDIPLPEEVTATDNCGFVDINYSEELQNEDVCDELYYIIRTWVATDNCGNSTTTSQILEVDECCETPDYCDASSNCSSYEYIKGVELNDIYNWSGSSNYTDFSTVSTDLIAGQTYTITLTPGYSGYCSYNENWQVWIDWNNDGDFNDSNELNCQMHGTKVTCQITVPNNASNCPIKMRITMNYGCYWADPCGHFNYGEVEDYTINVIDPACAPIEYCDIQSNCAGYEWINLVQLGDINNPSGSSSYSDFSSLSTNLSQGSSNNITLGAGYSSSSYNENWYVWIDFNQDGDFDDVGELAAQGYGTYNVNTTLDVPIDANLGTTQMRVVMSYYCDPYACGNISYGEIEDYTVHIVMAGTGKTQNGGNFDSLPDISEASFEIYNVYPNPAINNVAIDYSSDSETEVELLVFDIQGKLIIHENQSARLGYNSIRLDISQLSSGNYSIQIIGGENTDTQSLIVK